jgi:hypothetical protein
VVEVVGCFLSICEGPIPVGEEWEWEPRWPEWRWQCVREGRAWRRARGAHSKNGKGKKTHTTRTSHTTHTYTKSRKHTTAVEHIEDISVYPAQFHIVRDLNLNENTVRTPALLLSLPCSSLSSQALLTASSLPAFGLQFGLGAGRAVMGRD